MTTNTTGSNISINNRTTTNIAFQDLKYFAWDANVKEGKRQILKSISGSFSSGELTAIIGVSGAGKTSLLNVLAGYVTSGIGGSVTINGKSRNLKTFNQISSYIMQDNIIQPFLTVKESMTYATEFKLGHVTSTEKLRMIEELIIFLGLTECCDTLSERLSGGERKRLAIALELVNSPSIIFLDEPTTGLDYYAAKQCIELLKKVSSLNKIVICTIHQPPTSLLNHFDQIYIVADGFCVYNGSLNKMVQFLSDTGHTCPANSTPVDYMIEQVHLYSSAIDTFKRHIQNGKINLKETIRYHLCSLRLEEHINIVSSTSFYVQVYVLLSRMFVQKRRNRIGLYITVFHHVFSSVITAAIFGNIGNDASKIFFLLKYIMCIVTFFLYTYLLLPILSFPFERKFLKREHFNKWYSLEAYYLALTMSNIPIIILFGGIYSSITYYFTDQPLEMERLFGFFLVNYTFAITSLSFGYLIGSFLDVMKGSVVGAVTLGTSLMISAYGLDLKFQMLPFYQFMLNMTFTRNGLLALLDVLFYKRGTLPCSEDFCYFSTPEEMIEKSSVSLVHYSYHIGRLMIFYIVFSLLCYLALKCRLNRAVYARVFYYCKKIENMIKV